MAAQTASIPAEGSAAGQRDLLAACAACGYSLRGLGAVGRCPECGHDIAVSLRAHAQMLKRGVAPIELSPLRWVRKQGLGCAFLIVAPCFTASVPAETLLGLRHPWVFISQSVVCWILIAAALWIFGAADPAGAGLLGSGRWRRWIARSLRPTAIVFVCGSVLEILIFTLGRPSLPGAYRYWAAVHSVLAAGISIVVMAHLSILSARMDRSRLARVTIALAILLAVVFALQWRFLEMFFLTPSSAWVMVPQPVFGHVEAWVLVPYALVKWPRMNLEMGAWLAVLLSSVAAWVAVLRVWMALHQAVRSRADLDDASPTDALLLGGNGS